MKPTDRVQPCKNRFARLAALSGALLLVGCGEAPEYASARDGGPDAAQLRHDAGRPRDGGVLGPRDGGSGFLPDSGVDADGGPLDAGGGPPAITCSPWLPRDDPSFKPACGKTRQLFGHSYALAVQTNARSVCVIGKHRFRVIDTSDYFFDNWSASGDTALATFGRGSGGEMDYSFAKVGLATCDLELIDDTAPYDSLDASERLFVFSKKRLDLGWNTWEVNLVNRKIGETRSLLHPMNFVRSQVDNDHLVMQTGGDGDGRVRVFLLRSFDAAEPEQLGDVDAPQTFPSVYGKWAAWEDYRNGHILSGGTVNPDIFAWNIETNTEVAFATGDHREARPTVLPDGICWGDMRNGYEYGPGYLYNLDVFCRRFSDMREVALDTSEGNQSPPVRLDWGLAWISWPVDDGPGFVKFASEIPNSP